jgi:hypothetical protein
LTNHQHDAAMIRRAAARPSANWSPHGVTSCPHVFRCRRCRLELGLSKAGVLVIGNVVFRRQVVLACAGCGHGNVWRPDQWKKRIAARES